MTHAGCLHVDAKTLQSRLLPTVRSARAQVRIGAPVGPQQLHMRMPDMNLRCVCQVTGLLLGLVRDKCSALTTDLVAKASGLSERPVDLQPYMQLQVCSVMLKSGQVCELFRYIGSAQQA
jgi:hypothetical protein